VTTPRILAEWVHGAAAVLKNAAAALPVKRVSCQRLWDSVWKGDWKEFEADFSVVSHREVLGELFSSVISSNPERLEEGRAEVKAS
jgi:hypothetical protein